jgi:NhaP-type Na+/H+ or K+/H+ antiporter
MGQKQDFHLAEIVTLLFIGVYILSFICLGALLVADLQIISILALLITPAAGAGSILLLWRREKEDKKTVWAAITAVLFILSGAFLINIGLMLPDPTFALEPSEELGWSAPLLVCIAPGFLLLLVAAGTYWAGVLRPEKAARLSQSFPNATKDSFGPTLPESD